MERRDKSDEEDDDQSRLNNAHGTGGNDETRASNVHNDKKERRP
jgi:hypothetical protein